MVAKREIKITYVIRPYDFKNTFGRAPRNQKEFDEFVKRVDYYLGEAVDYEKFEQIMQSAYEDMKRTKL